MWEKVISEEQLKDLDLEDVLIKYPVNGSIADNFTHATPENTSPRVVVENDPITLTICLGYVHSKATGDPILGMHIGTVKAPVYKGYADIINAGVWWKFVEK